MELLQIGAQLLQSKLGSNIQTDDIASALSGLLGGDNFDLGSLVSKIKVTAVLPAWPHHG